MIVSLMARLVAELEPVLAAVRHPEPSASLPFCCTPLSR